MGNIDALRDWGHAKDYVRMMWMILQADKPEDWVIATGETTTVRDFIKLVFRYVGVEVEFKGKGVSEVGIVSKVSNNSYEFKIGQLVVSVDSKYFRPTEVESLQGDFRKAKKILNWKPKIGIKDLVKEMINNELKNDQ